MLTLQTHDLQITALPFNSDIVGGEKRSLCLLLLDIFVSTSTRTLPYKMHKATTACNQYDIKKESSTFYQQHITPILLI